MKKLPYAKAVAKSIQVVRETIQLSLNSINQAASRRLSMGDYTGADRIVSKAKVLVEFHHEVEALLKRWREVMNGIEGSGPGNPVTPLWQYYQPILHSVVQLGGACQRADLEEEVRKLMLAFFQAGDQVEMAKGRQRWQVMIQRSRKALVAEGWLESGSGLWWRITEAGRRAVQKPFDKDSLSRK